MTVFRNDTHREVWVDRWCHTCFQPQEAQRRLQGKDTMCPVMARHLKRGHKPMEWERMRNTDMEKSVKCHEYQPKPPTTRDNTQIFEDVPMFEVEAGAVQYVPVPGLPNREYGKDVDHA